MNTGFHNIGSIFFETKALSNSLGTGLDKLDEKSNKLHIQRNKVARSVNKLEFKFSLFVCFHSVMFVVNEAKYG